MIQVLKKELQKQFQDYCFDLDKKEITKNNIKTHDFWVDIINNTTLKITLIKDEEIKKHFGVYNLYVNRSHKWIWIKILLVCIDFCVKNGLNFSFTPSDEWWGFWKKLSSIVWNKQDKGDMSIVISWEELNEFQKDIENYLKNFKNLSK